MDAKADKGLVSIGGWESFGGTTPDRARWFSVVLDRSNAPWIFVKGEPFKLIAALELLAITVAVMIFGPGAPWQDHAGRSVLTAYTDNLVNSYVLDRFMSTSFPLSVVLMELAMQMQLMQLEMELQWIPREQNVEADALTNLEFEAFDPSKRIAVQLENLDFRILPELMQLAAKVDEEIVLKKSSKEKEKPAKPDPSKKLRVSQPWWPLSSVGVDHHVVQATHLKSVVRGLGWVGQMRLTWNPLTVTKHECKCGVSWPAPKSRALALVLPTLPPLPSKRWQWGVDHHVVQATHLKSVVRGLGWVGQMRLTWNKILN